MRERATILIVDDEAELCEVLEEYLNAQGYTALGAENAAKVQRPRPLRSRGTCAS